MTTAHERSTNTQTVAATQSRMLARTAKLVDDLGERLPLIDDAGLCDLARIVMGEVARREALLRAALDLIPQPEETSP